MEDLAGAVPDLHYAVLSLELGFAQDRYRVPGLEESALTPNFVQEPCEDR